MRTYTMLASIELEGDDFKTAPYGLATYDPSKHVHLFRLMDGDGDPMGYGLSANSSNFDPLDDYQDAWGCTSIEYFENGKWGAL